MSFGYLRLMEALELLAMVSIVPTVAAVLAYRGWKTEPENLKFGNCVRLCLGSSGALFVLLWLVGQPFALRPVWIFLHFVCFALFCLSLGTLMGYGFRLMVVLWRSHTVTRLKQ